MADAMTADELKWNEQAAGAAGAVLSEPVQAATRCEQVTVGMAAGAVGMGKGMQAMANFGEKQGRFMSKMMPGMKGVGDMRTGGLPGTFVLAVTPTKIHAIEAKEKKGKDLSAGKVLKTWDRQVLTLYLPNQMLANMAPGLGQPTQFMVGRDPASEAVVTALAS